MDRSSIFATFCKNECEKLTVNVRVFCSENDESLEICFDTLKLILVHFVSIIHSWIKSIVCPWTWLRKQFISISSISNCLQHSNHVASFGS